MQDARGSHPDWQTGQAITTPTRLLQVQTDDWSYAARDAVPAWIDASGTWHDGGWPNCLDVPQGRHLQVRFAATEVTVEDTTWRTIEIIDCRGTVLR